MDYKIGSFGILDTDGMEDAPLKLLDGGIEKRYREKYDYYNSNRKGYSGYLFQYTLKGKGCFEKEGESCEVSEEKGFIIRFPEESRYFLPQDIDTPWEFVYLHFEGPAAEPFFRKLNQTGGSPYYFAITSQPVRMLLALQQRLTEGCRLTKYEGGEFLYLFLCALLRETEQPSLSGGDSMARRAALMMEQEYGSLNGVEEVADRLSVSLAHFSRSFKAAMGLAPIQYLSNLRVQSAMNELLNTEDTLETIAHRNGFANGNYFCKVFKKNVGISPSHYKREKKF